MAGGKGKSTGGKAGPKEVAGKSQKSHSAKAGLQVRACFFEDVFTEAMGTWIQCLRSGFDLARSVEDQHDHNNDKRLRHTHRNKQDNRGIIGTRLCVCYLARSHHLSYDPRVFASTIKTHFMTLQPKGSPDCSTVR